jgi:glyoxylase-like metal-dependent hydrolase (beta-lactamase superfamily II)
MSEEDKLPPLPTEDDGIYQVFAMCFARREARTRDVFLVPDPHEGIMPMAYYVWIVRNAHRTVLVDIGFNAVVAKKRNRVLDIDPVEGLKRLGIDPESIDDIVLTHLHYDHVGSIDRFPNARFHVQDAEVAFATGRHIASKAVRGAFEEEDIIALIRRNFAERVVFHNGDDDLLPGLSIYAMPGHTPVVQSVLVNSFRGPVLLASDSAHFYANILLRSPFWLTASMADTLDSYTRLVKVAGGIDRVIPGHDARVLDLYPTASVNGVTVATLHETPKYHDPVELSTPRPVA